MLKFISVLLLSLISFMAWGDAAYPTTNPSYVPMAQQASIALPTGASTSATMALNNVNSVTFRISGTCTGLTSAVQVTNDFGTTKTNWTSVNFWVSPALGTAAGTIDADGSLTTTGYYKVKTDGANQIRLNISALTAACNVQFTGSTAQFDGAYF